MPVINICIKCGGTGCYVCDWTGTTPYDEEDDE